MSRVKDFNLLKVADVSSSSTNTNSVSVVVNTENSGQNSSQQSNDVNFTQAPIPTQTLFPSVVNQVNPDQGTVVYPTGSAAPQGYPSESTQIQALQQQLEDSEHELKFYKLLSSTLSNILKDNNPKMLINLLDMSGKIIIEATDLIELIAIKTNTDKNLIDIQFRDEDVSCIARVNPIKEISNIKIDNETFQLKYNKAFNILQDVYNISLSKCLIPEIPLDKGITYRR